MTTKAGVFWLLTGALVAPACSPLTPRANVQPMAPRATASAPAARLRVPRSAAQRCSLPSRADASEFVPRVSLEIVTLSAGAAGPPPSVGQSFGDWLAAQHGDVRIDNLEAEVGTPATLAWDGKAKSGGAEPCASLRHDLTALSRLTPDRQKIELSILIEPAPPLGTPKESWHVPEHRKMKTTLVVDDQQTLIVRPSVEGRADAELLVITPYLLWTAQAASELAACRFRAMGDAGSLTLPGAPPARRPAPPP